MYIDSIIYAPYLTNFNKIIKIKCMKLIINLYNHILHKSKAKCLWRGEEYAYHIVVILHALTLIDLDIPLEGP